MKKGFTMIELLIVIVIVALLVAVSVPKYKTAMEKSRAQEAITNLNLAANLANAYYLSHNASYDGFSRTSDQMDKAKSVYFNTVTVAAAGNTATITAGRKTGAYSLVLTLTDGEVTGRTCVSSKADLCDAIGWGV